MLAFLPMFGGDEAAEQAVREGNSLYEARQYESALKHYDAAAEDLPNSPEIEFNRGNALFKNREQDRALDHYLAALTTDDSQLASRAKYNFGVIKYRQGLAAAQDYQEALTLTETAIQYFRESLELDGSYDDARYNLELAYRFQRRVEEELLRAQRNADVPLEKTSLQRGQALSDRVRDEGSGLRQANPDANRQPHGQRGNETPESFANNEERSKPPQSARLPIAMSPDAAHQMMEQLRQQLQAAEVQRQQQRRNRLHQADERTPW
jgi:tetratricopeptide (TPR) repeat protein